MFVICISFNGTQQVRSGGSLFKLSSGCILYFYVLFVHFVVICLMHKSVLVFLSIVIVVLHGTTCRPSLSGACCAVVQDDSDEELIDGFYVYFAPYGEQRAEYLRHHVVFGSTVRHAVLSALDAHRSYSVRMQSFSEAAGVLSKLSNTVVERTHGMTDIEVLIQFVRVLFVGDNWAFQLEIVVKTI